MFKVRPLGVKYTLTTLVYDPAAFIKWGFLFLFFIIPPPSSARALASSARLS